MSFSVTSSLEKWNSLSSSALFKLIGWPCKMGLIMGLQLYHPKTVNLVLLLNSYQETTFADYFKNQCSHLMHIRQCILYVWNKHIRSFSSIRRICCLWLLMLSLLWGSFFAMLCTNHECSIYVYIYAQSFNLLKIKFNILLFNNAFGRNKFLNIISNSRLL